MEITTLVENLTYLQGTKGEHGLSFLIEVGGERILFDTGQSDLLTRNARALGVDLAAIDAVVISHGHYDHTGGFSAFFEINDHAPVYLKPGCFDEKFSTKGGQHEIGIDRDVKDQLQDRFISVNNQIEVAPGLWIVPEIGQYYSFEQASPVMRVRHENQLVPDPFEDELFMVYHHSGGSTVFAGCAHRGIGNICRTAMDVTGHEKVKMVLGGTHLKGASQGRISKTVDAFREMDVEQFALGHCTGLPAFFAFSQAFGEKVRYAHVGTRFFPYD
ncbi:MAG: MBL fold metallo-hydrolase [Marinilabiliaceae bacterium]